MIRAFLAISVLAATCAAAQAGGAPTAPPPDEIITETIQNAEPVAGGMHIDPTEETTRSEPVIS